MRKRKCFGGSGHQDSESAPLLQDLHSFEIAAYSSDTFGAATVNLTSKESPKMARITPKTRTGNGLYVYDGVLSL